MFFIAALVVTAQLSAIMLAPFFSSFTSLLLPFFVRKHMVLNAVCVWYQAESARAFVERLPAHAAAVAATVAATLLDLVCVRAAVSGRDSHGESKHSVHVSGCLRGRY